MIDRAIPLLFEAYGPQAWWPVHDDAEGEQRAVEIAVGAILVQHTAWKNVEKAIDRLRASLSFSVAAIAAVSPEDLAELIRPAGTPSVKARRLRALASFLVDAYGGSLSGFLRGVEERGVALLRRDELLRVHGVGPETADAILLYAGGAPLFVVDAYARRIVERHGWGDAREPYARLQRRFEAALPREATLYNEAHALIVRVGVERCRARRADCEGCPLQTLLPPGGPLIG